MSEFTPWSNVEDDPCCSGVPSVSCSKEAGTFIGGVDISTRGIINLPGVLGRYPFRLFSSLGDKFANIFGIGTPFSRKPDEIDALVCEGKKPASDGRVVHIHPPVDVRTTTVAEAAGESILGGGGLA